jgi:hypothetical protein
MGYVDLISNDTVNLYLRYRIICFYSDSMLTYNNWLKHNLTHLNELPISKSKYLFMLYLDSKLHYLYSIWYSSIKVKKIMPHLTDLDEYFTVISLAHLIMQKGYYNKSYEYLFIDMNKFSSSYNNNIGISISKELGDLDNLISIVKVHILGIK